MCGKISRLCRTLDKDATRELAFSKQILADFVFRFVLLKYSLTVY